MNREYNGVLNTTDRVLQVSDLSLREWSPQMNLLSKIPEKAQRGFITVNLQLTCIGVISDYIAIGTNVGLIYWYNRKQDNLERLKLEGSSMNPITCINVVSCENYMIAAGNRDGLITIFQIPKIRDNEVRIFTVKDVHNGLITTVSWSSNGMSLFSGDISGNVAMTEIDFCSGISKSSKILNEEHEIVQLSYLHQNLLISSTLRTIIYSNKTKLITKLGTQDRKISGTFGGIFAAGLWSKNLKIYAARPGLRLWVVDLEGSVQNTLIFRDLIKKSHPSIPLINRARPEVEEKNLLLEKQFGTLFNFMGKYLVTWHNNILYVLDPVEAKVLYSCSQLTSILSVDVHKDEIFIVETSRNIVRIAPKHEEIIPEIHSKVNIESTTPSTSDFKIAEQPLSFIASKIKETSRALPKLNSTFLTTMRNVLEADLSIQEGQLPNEIPVKPPNLPDAIIPNENQISPELQQSNFEEIEKFDKISKHSYQEVLLTQFRPEKKSKKRNRDAMSDSISLSSQGSNNSEGLGDSPEKDLKLPNPLPSAIPQVGKFETVVSPTALRSKEEMLAKLLNWNELLPSFQQDHLDRRDSNTSAQDISKWSTSSTDDTVGPLISMHDTDDLTESSMTPTFENELSPTSSCALSQTEADISLSFQKQRSIPLVHDSDINEIEDFSGIYDGNCHTQPLVNSLDFFGPPSGSSNVTLTECIINSNSEPHEDTSGIELQSIAINLPIQDMSVQGILLNDDSWTQYELPSSVTIITSCEKYLICINSQHIVFYTSLVGLRELRLCWIKATFQAIQFSCSPDESIVWRIDPTGTLFMKTSSNEVFSEKNWEVICDKVKYAALGITIGFIIKTDHSLHACQFADDVDMAFSFVPLPFSSTLSSIHILEDSIWGLGNDGRIFYRTGVTTETPYGELWNELRLGVLPIASLSLGPQGSVWTADVHNHIRFINGFRRMYPGWKYNVWNVMISDDLIPSTGNAQRSSLSHWKQKLTEPFRWAQQLGSNNTTLVGSLPLLTSSHSMVAFAIQGETSVFINSTCVSGHRWEHVTIDSGIKTWKWNGVYAGSIYNDHGFLWLEEIKGKLFYLQAGKGALQPLDTPCANIAHIATAPESIWVLDDRGTIYARCNINSANELGNGWDKMEFSPLSDGLKIVHMSCGSETAWSCDNKGGVYIRTGTLDPPSSTDISPAWIHVDGSPSYSLDAIFTKVYVGPTDRIVWALDSRGSIYAREAVYPDFLIGTAWVLVPSVEAVHLAISELSVWALSGNGDIFRRCGISNTNFVGTSWKRIPGSAKALTVSVCDEVWTLDTSGCLLKHSMEQLFLSSKISSVETSYEDEEGSTDWEIVG